MADQLLDAGDIFVESELLDQLPQLGGEGQVGRVWRSMASSWRRISLA
jgi:hypothetical protein